MKGQQRRPLFLSRPQLVGKKPAPSSWVYGQTPDRGRGVDRVPDRVNVDRPDPEVLVEHPDANYAQRRAYKRKTGRRARSTANIPHVNPKRDAKSLKSGRLRAELVDQVRGQFEAGDRP